MKTDSDFLRKIACMSWAETYEWDDDFRRIADAIEARDREIERLRGLAEPLRQAALTDDWHTFDSLIAALAGTGET